MENSRRRSELGSLSNRPARRTDGGLELIKASGVILVINFNEHRVLKFHVLEGQMSQIRSDRLRSLQSIFSGTS